MGRGRRRTCGRSRSGTWSRATFWSWRAAWALDPRRTTFMSPVRPPLHREPPPHLRLVQLAGRAGQDDVAAVHDAELVRQRAGEVVVLLDEQDRHPAPLAHERDHPADVLD